MNQHPFRSTIVKAEFKMADNMEELSTKKEGYVIGIDPEGPDAALVMFTREPGGTLHDFIVVMCPPNLIQPYFWNEFIFEEKPDKKLLQEFKSLSLGKSMEMKREGQTDTFRYMNDGEWKHLPIDNDLYFSISNGLVSKKVGTGATRHVYRIFTKCPVWFCEKEIVAVKKIYSVDTVASAQHECIVLKEYLDPVRRRKPRAIVRDIARITKLDMSEEVRGKNKLLGELEVLFAASTSFTSASPTPTDFDRCLQFALCGESTFFPMGRFGLCKNGRKKCLCDVVKESVHIKLWKQMKNFRYECHKKRNK